MNIKDFILGYLIGKGDGGGGASIEPLTVTENGEYSEEGIAYSPVNVNVAGGGGASNIKTGTFTATTAGQVGTVDTGYDGNGYPIAMLIVVDGGVSNSSNTSWYNLIHRYAVGLYVMTKSVMATAANYMNGTTDYADLILLYKSSTTSATSYNRTGDVNQRIYKQQAPYEDSLATVAIPSKSSFKYVSSDTSYGFAPGITYRYWIIYSE
jgi:hypothetical protein